MATRAQPRAKRHADPPPAGSGALLEAILTSSHANFFLVEVGADGGFTYSLLDRDNSALAGVPRDKKILAPGDPFGPEDAAAVTQRYRACIAGGRPLVYEEELTGADGRRWWQTSLTPIFEDGRVIRLVGIAIDITERK